MAHTLVNIMVDVKQSLTRESGESLVEELRRLHGVSRARVSPWISRLVLVDFDPMLTNTQRIFGAVVYRGFDARLVGM